MFLVFALVLVITRALCMLKSNWYMISLKFHNLGYLFLFFWRGSQQCFCFVFQKRLRTTYLNFGYLIKKVTFKMDRMFPHSLYKLACNKVQSSFLFRVESDK